MTAVVVAMVVDGGWIFGDLYTWGDGQFGILGHGNEVSHWGDGAVWCLAYCCSCRSYGWEFKF